MKKNLCIEFTCAIWLLCSALIFAAPTSANQLTTNVLVAPYQPHSFNYEVSGKLSKELIIELDNQGEYARLSLYAGASVLAENIDIPRSGRQSIRVLVQFPAAGETNLNLRSLDSNIIISQLRFNETPTAILPQFVDISDEAGIDRVDSIKYGGPSVADIDNDGDYDFILNNHNEESSKLYWNNNDGTVTKHNKNLARWYMHDLHGTALGDYDNDGDLDLVLTQGGGNGKKPSTANFYHNEASNLVLMTKDVGINKGGRGRGARWSDMDLDGDLDLILLNETSLQGDKPQHFFYENVGQKKFVYKQVSGIQDVHQSRALVTDFNGDNIDDVILYGPLSLWQGNGDFTFTNVNHKVPEELRKQGNIMAITDIDIDNDGDLDLYLARGKAFEGGRGENPSFDFDPLRKIVSIKPRGFKGIDEFDFVAPDDIRFYDYYFLSQGVFRGKDYPVFLGASKTQLTIQSGDEFTLQAKQAEGWPDVRSANGLYFGHIGKEQWKAALVRDGDLFWGYKFSLSGVVQAKSYFEPENRNEADILLRNDGNRFVDVSQAWNLPAGGNALGVTTGDFNNDSFSDLMVSRWGAIAGQSSNYLLLNKAGTEFQLFTTHGANDIGGSGNGDMGQAFDFDLDGNLDLLSGNEGGKWYLYKNTGPQIPSKANYALVRVGYSPTSNIDPIGAELVLRTENKVYTKRIGSAGEIFSQSLLNIVHFGLAEQSHIDSVTVRWRNGETLTLNNPQANQITNAGKNDFAKPPQIAEIQNDVAVQAYISITNKQAIAAQLLESGKAVDVEVEFHAGTGHKLIAADEGGLRFWLRHFRSKWFPVKDRIEVDQSVLYQQHGISSRTLSLEGFAPTSELAENHFYLIRVSFTASDGNTYEDTIYPLIIKK